MDIHDILNNLSFYLSLLVSVGVLAGLAYAIWHYFRPLQMYITYIHVAQIQENTSLVLIRLSMINNSSRGKVVYNFVPESKTENVIVEEAFQEFDSNSRTVVYKLTKEGLGYPLPMSVLLLPPLDIPPHQSRSTWRCLVTKVNHSLQTESPHGETLLERLPVDLHVEGINTGGKVISYCDKTIYPMRLTSSPTYETYFPQKFEFPDFSFMLEPPIVFFIIIILLLLIILSPFLKS